jgi:PrcB C-terminal
LKALETTTRFGIEGDVLRLYANHSPILVFRAGATDAGGATEKASGAGGETTAISISEIAKGQQCGITTQRFEVIRNSSSFTNLWLSHSEGFSPVPEQPVVDFDQNMVIAAFLGEQSTGGYSIEITGVAELADSIVVNVKGALPGAGCMLTTAVSKPYHVVTVPKSSKPIAFVTTIERANCA